MNSKSKQTQPQNPTATSLATARTAPLAQAGGGQEAAESLASGAPPSNTAPDNCNTPYFQALRWGVDSLYLSYPGELSRERDDEFKALKQLAQSNEIVEQAKAQFCLGKHIFEVKEQRRLALPLHPRRRRIPDSALPPGPQSPDGLCEGIGQIPGACWPGWRGKTSLRSARSIGRNPGVSQRQPDRPLC